ncbi:TIGR04104 family putative zinc finger protein [Jeotgalicoccus sp. WY2]|uniref:TIGR04104 family putative zinc finger protein n=1 Tax=Jeotgalicoccus sp. WY2 TaxID=2708346 RepID=UPI001BD5D06F
MARCTKCQTEWTFKDKVRTFTNLDGSAKCPNCGEKQYLSLKSKRQGSMLSMIVILAMFVPGFFDTPLMVHIIIGLIAVVIVLLLQVSLIKLSGKEEFPI